MDKALIILLLAVAADWQMVQNIFTAAPPAALATPAFVSASGKNSLLSVALAADGAGTISSGWCASFSYCLPYAETALAGNLGVCGWQYANGGTPVTATMADDKSDTYSVIGSSAEDGSTGKYVNMGYSANLTSGAHKVSITFGTTAVTAVTAQCLMFNNIATSTPLRSSNTQVGTSSTTMTGPALTASANDLVFAYFCRTGTTVMTSGSFTAGSGYTFGLTQYQDGCASEFKVSSGATETPTMTMGSASTYIVYAALFKASNGSAGSAPTSPYLARVISWSSQSSVSTASFKFQFQSASGDLLVGVEAGGPTYSMNSITDSGSNSWTQAGICNGSVGCVSSGNYTAEYYVQNAGAETTNTQTTNFTGTGDATIFFYEFVGMPIGAYTTRLNTVYTSMTTTTLFPNPAQAFRPNAIGNVLTVALAPIQFNTASSISSPVSTYFDAGAFGGELINGGSIPESIIDQNNVWSHSYQAGITGSQNWQWGLDASTSEGNGGSTLDLLAFVEPGGIGILNNAAKTQNWSSGSTIAVTIPSTVGGTGDLIACSTGTYDGATARTVSKICTDGGTCAAGNSFTQVPGAGTASNNSIMGTDLWYLQGHASGVTTVTMTASGTMTGGELTCWEVYKGTPASWSVDNSGNGAKVSGGASCSTTCTGGSVTTTGGNDFCIGVIETAGTGVTANPKAGNAFIYTPTANFSSGGAATALLTQTNASTTPVWSTGAGTFNSATVCFE